MKYHRSSNTCSSGAPVGPAGGAPDWTGAPPAGPAGEPMLPLLPPLWIFSLIGCHPQGDDASFFSFCIETRMFINKGIS